MNAELRTKTAITALQIKTLLKRLEAVSYAYTQKRSAVSRKDDREPSEVKAARAIVNRFDRQRREKHTAAYNKVRADLRDVSNVIVFGDMAKALAAVEKIEAAAK